MTTNMRTIKILLALVAAAAVAGAQTSPQSLLITRVYGITSAWIGECGAGVVDNRSQNTRHNNYHSIFATGSGSWTVAINYSDTSCTGPWTSFGSASAITQASNPPIAYANGYHPYIQVAVTGSAMVTYSAEKDFFLSTSVGSLVFPVTPAQGGTGLTNPTAHTVPVAEGGSSFGLISPSTAGYVMTSNGTGADPTFQPPAAQLPSGLQGQFLRVQPNTGNNTTLQFTYPPAVNSTDYNWGPQTPGGTLLSGQSNVITLTPGPLGVAGTHTVAAGLPHLVYITGGTAEATPITGGTCDGTGQASCTITVIPTFSHGSGWTVGPVWPGVQEAIYAGAVTDAAGISVAVRMPIGSVLANGTLYCPGTYACDLGGSGESPTVIRSTFSAGTIISFVASTDARARLHDFTMMDSTSTNRTSGSSILIQGYPDAIMDNLTVLNAYTGITQNNTGGGPLRANNIQVYAVNVGWEITGYFSMLALTNFNIHGTNKGIWVHDTTTTGIYVSNGVVDASFGTTNSVAMLFVEAVANSINEVQITNVDMETGTGTPLQFVGNGSYGNNSFLVSNCRLNGAVYSAAFINTQGVILSDSALVVSQSTATANVLVSGTKWSTFSNLTMISTTGSGPVANAVQYAGSGNDYNVWDHIRIMTQNGAVNPTAGIGIDNAAHNIIRNSDLALSTTPLNISSGVTDLLVTNNKGIDDVIPAVASASTLAMPINPTITITGTTPVTAVTFPGISGSRGTMTATDGVVYLVAGGTIGNTVGLARNIPYSWTWDGTKVWITGQRTVTSVSAATNSTSSIGSTALLTAPTPGLYRVAWTLTTGSVSGGSATALVTTGWTDAVGAKTSAGAALTLAAAANQSGSVLVNVASGNLTYATTYAAGSGGNYNLQMTAELVK